MSIYCSIFGFGDFEEHSRKCKRIRKVNQHTYRQDDSKPCTCGVCPIEYQHSGVLPSDSDKRGGNFGIAAIPGHITRDGRDDKPEDNTWYPWLRVSIVEAHDNTVILTRKQVEALRDALNEWLRRSRNK